VLRTPAGAVDSVVGAYFPGLRPVTTKKLDKQAARAAVEKQVGARGKWSNTLRLDPRTGVLFFEVQSQRDASRPVRWVNAGTGRTIKAFDAIAEGEGTGVKGDTKPLLTTRNTAAKTYELRSPDARQVTYTADNGTSSATLMTDSNDIWDFNIPSLMGKSQAPGVDAHYYANVVDDFYRDTFGRDSIDGQGMPIVSVVHWDKAYCNAFWNGAYMTYGDGDGPTCLPLSGGLDVDGHELTHGVTEYTSNLIYENESGALNEGFSDMMGNTIEFYAAKKNLDPAAKPDFRIGEDVINTQTPATAGFRNMGDPGEFGDPDHVVDKYTGEEDGGGVHTNSGIANHAYYLTVQGGQNAGCRATTQRAATHTEDCKVKVPALGLDRAAQVYYAGFSSLPEFANFCDARNATTAVAGARDGKSVGLAWDAVGVHKGCAGGTPPPPPCTSNPNASFPIESPHPYGNNGDCTWTYNGAAGGYRLHFTSFDLEADFDYLYVRDGGGATVATYTGQLGAFDSPCITTPASSVRLVTDPAVTGQGFVISGTVPC
jgi:Zn-dependent metalloprotease